MNKIFLALALLSATCFAQPSDNRVVGSLTASSTDCSTAGSCFTTSIPNYSQVAVTVMGTYAGVTIQFEFSDDGGVTWYADTCARTDQPIAETSEVLPTNQTRAWDCGVSASTNFRVRASAFGSGTVTVGFTRTAVQLEPAATVTLNVIGNPCLNPNATFTSVQIALSGTALTQIQALATGQKIYICSFLASNATATTTLQLEYGTGSNCGSGTQNIMGPFTIPASTAAPLVIPGPFIFATPVSQAICYVLTGSTPTGSLTINYIQQ